MLQEISGKSMTDLISIRLEITKPNYQIGGWNERAAEMDAALFNDKLRVGQMNTRFEEYKVIQL